MSDKVKLTKEQHEAIIKLKESYNDYEIVANHINTGWNSVSEISLNQVLPDDMIRALYIGYEVETTSEEKIFNEYLRRDTGDQTDMAYQNGMEFVLCALGIIIKQIND